MKGSAHMDNETVYAISFLLTTIVLAILWFRFLHRRHFPKHMSDQKWHEFSEKLREQIKKEESATKPPTPK
jgi:membrane protein implicated in regulation of membrane protease activity